MSLILLASEIDRMFILISSVCNTGADISGLGNERGQDDTYRYTGNGKEAAVV